MRCLVLSVNRPTVSEVALSVPSHSFSLSPRRQWYAVDFGRNDVERLRCILPFLKVGCRRHRRSEPLSDDETARCVGLFVQGPAHADLQAMLSSAEGRGIKVAYKDYDWTLNEATD